MRALLLRYLTTTIDGHVILNYKLSVFFLFSLLLFLLHLFWGCSGVKNVNSRLVTVIHMRDFFNVWKTTGVQFWLYEFIPSGVC